MKSYLVGGAVRDELLGLAIKDRDWVTVGATPNELTQAGYQPVGNDFPVFLHPDSKEEYALARTERKTGAGYKGFECYFSPDVSLEDDLKRRDLTINAIAKDDSTGEIIDPYDGQSDLSNKWLRHVSEAFCEDPLRVLRVARFYARFHHLGFKIHPETIRLMQAMSRSGELKTLTPERVFQEIQKALESPSPQAFLRGLRECGALAVLFPDIDRLYGVPATVKWHPEIDSGVHLEMVLAKVAELSQDTTIRFAALMHDLGKGITKRRYWPKHYGHEEAGAKLVQAFCKTWRVPKKYESLALLATKFHGLSHRILDSDSPKALLTLLNKLDAFRNPDLLQPFLVTCEADAGGRLFDTLPRYVQAEFILKGYDACKDVDTQAILAAGYEGVAIKEEINKVRLKKLKAFYAEHYLSYTSSQETH